MPKLFLIALLFLAVACSDQGTSVSAPAPVPAPAPAKVMSEPAASAEVGLSTDEAQAVAQARTVLAAHLTSSEVNEPNVDDAELTEISAQQWRNSSLGCPEPGEMSAQVMTQGYAVVLMLDGVRHQIHTGGGGGRVCERPQGKLKAPNRPNKPAAM